MESRPPSTESGHAESGERLAEISRRVVQLHKEHYGKGPTKARTFIDGDVVVCLLEGGYLSAERTLVAHGRGRMVSEGRAALQTVLRQAFTEVVETALNRRVSSFMSAPPTTTLSSASRSSCWRPWTRSGTASHPFRYRQSERPVSLALSRTLTYDRPCAGPEMHHTTVRFGADLWDALESETSKVGVSIAQSVREAALARLIYAAGKRDDAELETALIVAVEG